MAWNPENYNQFKAIRYRPFYDLAAFLKPAPKLSGIDLGCGTGEQTALLVNKLGGSTFIGIDSSAEMLAKATAFAHENLQFKQQSIEETLNDTQPYDLIFSNAALQWIDNHAQRFPRLLKLLAPKGQVAIQMPVQNDNLLNKILYNLASEEPYAKMLNYFNRESPVLTMDAYAQLLFENDITDIEIMEKVYPIIAENADELYAFIAGTALIPYVDPLSPTDRTVFISEFKSRIQKSFPKFPAIYAFKRMLMYGVKKH
ncbi:methyltransferase domain-containing protein [Sphingobacterium sp. Mn56C]|uniref:methyltransferase domain-containing protein n=1 Tax=Sphingobacterium sp. Mn56C TaxID=3395261 RepID=UPI003BD5E232